MDVHQYSTTKEASAVPAGLAYELSLLSHPSLITGLHSSGPLEHQSSCNSKLRMDGQGFGEVWDETQANVYVPVSGICWPSCFISLTWTSLICEAADRYTICRGLVQDCIVEGLALPGAPSDCSEMPLCN